ncbi:MAG: chemotaxis protein CheW [Pleurocapsa sp.]
MIQEYFCVQLSDSIRLGLPLVDMTTVAQFDWQDICIVPGVAAFWYGVVNYKGSLLWVLDTDRLFDLKQNNNGESSHGLTQKPVAVILTHQVEATPRRVALIVRQLEGILSLDSSKLMPLATSAHPALQKLCRAMVDQNEQTTYILNSPVFLKQLHQQSILIAA